MISVAIPFADRSPETLRFVCDNLLFCGADEVVIGNIGQQHLGWDDVVKEVHVPIGAWYPALARNNAAGVTRGDTIVFALADTFCSTPYMFKSFCDLPAGIVRTAKDCVVLNRSQSEQALKGARGFTGPERYKDGFLIGALMVINRDDLFNTVRQWDPEQLGWGWNDRDFLGRCKEAGMKHEIFPLQMMHLWHERLSTSRHDVNKAASEKKLRTNWWGYRC